MIRIEPNTLYGTYELKKLLKGFVSLDTLREYGLIGLPGKGYFGKNIVDSIDRYCYSRNCQRGMVDGKEQNHVTKENPFFDNANRTLQPSPRRSEPMESGRQRFIRQTKADQN